MIKYYGQKILRQESEDVIQGQSELISILETMRKTLAASKGGVGLAAPQVGFNKSIVITGQKDEDVFLNPYITETSEETCSMDEGCLSIPGIYESVKRPKKIKLEYDTYPDWNHVEVELDGMKARILQHEVDHLDGVLFIDKISPFRKRMIGNKLKALAKKNKGD